MHTDTQLSNKSHSIVGNSRTLSHVYDMHTCEHVIHTQRTEYPDKGQDDVKSLK